MTLDGSAVASLAVAAGAGLLVGLERERRKGSGPTRSAAGLRTFLVASLAGALSALAELPGLVPVVVAGVGLLSAMAYWRSSSRDPGLTTELALVTMSLIGVLAVPQPALAAGCGVALAGLLAARDRLHRFATRALSEAELHDGLGLAALALVLMPLLPGEAQSWLAGLSLRQWVGLVVLILALQAAAHVALRLFGPALGLSLAGFFGGFISSTATIASMGSRARAHPAHARSCTGAAVLSTAATWVLSAILLLGVSPEAAAQLMPAAVAGGCIAAFIGLWLSWALDNTGRERRSRVVPQLPASGPLRVREALLVAVLLGLASAAVGWAQARFGTTGVWLSSALAALADAQSSVAALGALHAAGRLEAEVVVQAIVGAVAANSLTRIVVAAVSAGPAFAAQVGASLLASTGAAAAVAYLGS
jgi:uncharacterized membrane protein (DUF4010 family)